MDEASSSKDKLAMDEEGIMADMTNTSSMDKLDYVKAYTILENKVPGKRIHRMDRKSRKNKKEEKRKIAADKTALDFGGYFHGATNEEITEVIEFMRDKIMALYETYSLRDELMNYCICMDTQAKYLLKHPDPKYNGPSNLIDFLALFNLETLRLGFDSILTYVRFIKLTFLEENGTYRIVSENEQKDLKHWLHIKKNFMKKRGIYVDIATPESTRVLEITEK